MVNTATAIVLVICIVALILGIRVYLESRKLYPPGKMKDKQDDDTRF